MGIFGGVGASQVWSAASGGKVYAFNHIDETTAVFVAPANTSRQKITFHNPGTSDIFIAPQKTQNLPDVTPTNPGSDHPLTISNAALGGTFRVFANGGILVIEGECQGLWQAIAVTGAGNSNPLTVMDSNVA